MNRNKPHRHFINDKRRGEDALICAHPTVCSPYIRTNQDVRLMRVFMERISLLFGSSLSVAPTNFAWVW